MTERVLTDAEHQLLCNIVDNEVHRLAGLEADGMQPETPAAQVERLSDLLFGAVRIVLQ